MNLQRLLTPISAIVVVLVLAVGAASVVINFTGTASDVRAQRQEAKYDRCVARAEHQFFVDTGQLIDFALANPDADYPARAARTYGRHVDELADSLVVCARRHGDPAR